MQYKMPLIPASSGVAALNTGCAHVGLSTQRALGGHSKWGSNVPFKASPSCDTLQILPSLINCHCLKMPFCW